jgi:hypothetical protein
LGAEQIQINFIIMNELTTTQRIETQKFNPEVEKSKILSQLGKLAGNLPRLREAEKSLEWAKFNITIEKAIGSIVNFSREPQKLCNELWEAIKKEGLKKNLFNNEAEFENRQFGISGEVAIGKILQQCSSNVCHSDAEGDAGGCDYLLNPDSQEEICLQLKIARDSDEKRPPDVRIGYFPHGTRAIIELNYQDDIGVFYNPSTGEPSKNLRELLIKELRDNKLVN